MKKLINTDEEHYTERNYPLTIKPNSSKLGSINEVFNQGPVITFVADDSKKVLLGNNATTKYEEYDSSPNRHIIF